jgi:hypothetical protein
VTRAELLVQPARIIIIVAVTVIFKSLTACALAVLAVTLLAAPVFYVFKERCGTTDYRRLYAAMGKSAGVTLICLTFPALVAFHFGIGRSRPVSVVIPIGLSLICVALWLVGVAWLRHPFATSSIYQRIVARLAVR